MALKFGLTKFQGTCLGNQISAARGRMQYAIHLEEHVPLRFLSIFDNRTSFGKNAKRESDNVDSDTSLAKPNMVCKSTGIVSLANRILLPQITNLLKDPDGGIHSLVQNNQ